MDHDVVLFGATGFTGKLVAEYLASHPRRISFSSAIAGRSPEKLAALRSSLAGAAPEIIVADTADSAEASKDCLCLGERGFSGGDVRPDRD